MERERERQLLLNASGIAETYMTEIVKRHVHIVPRVSARNMTQ